ncbi:unnamed protein product, partial [Ectocarpus fasciculatus]
MDGVRGWRVFMERQMTSGVLGVNFHHQRKADRGTVACPPLEMWARERWKEA